MIKGLYNAAAGMIPRESQLEVVSNNLANANTTGFKADRRYFRTVLNSRLLHGGENGGPVKLPEEMYYIGTDQSEGSLEKTGNPLDVSISGKGFFAIETDDGEGYTRNGNFRLNDNNELITSEGFRVLGEKGIITIEGHDVVVNNQGEIEVDGNTVDKLKMVDFQNPYKLRRNGYGLFVPETKEQPQQAGNFNIMQGYIEKSNVNVISEMVLMIELNHVYEALQKAISANDDTLRMAVNEIASVR
ncbi:flagellar basal-body rod protein FlgF [bacterium]|nr:flagellar basal-body rod protein FlgF [bacterium]